jgi:hypothetical protein
MVVRVERLLGPSYGEIDLYAMGSGVPIGGWRDYLTQQTLWTGAPFLGDSTTWVFIQGSRDTTVKGNSFVVNAPTAQALHPTPFQMVPPSALTGGGMQDFAASDTTLAFDIEPIGHIGRTSSSTPDKFTFTTVGDLINPLVRGDDVLAKSYYGNGGWAEEFTIAADGSASVLRAKANTEVDNFATDGTTLFWTEGSGGSPGDWAQPTIGAWSAPFSTDASTLNTTAKQLADVSGKYALSGIAFGGYYAVESDRDKVWVVRASDGAKQQVSAGANRWFGALVYVSATELWAVMSSTANVSGVAFQRQTLAAWP